MAVFELLMRPESHVAATVLSTMPSQSSSTMLPAASNAPGLTSLGSPQPSVVASQQSPPHVVKPSPSASASSSTWPLQLSSMPFPQISPLGTHPCGCASTPLAPIVVEHATSRVIERNADP